MSLHFRPMPTETAAALWNGGLDAYGMQPECARSDGKGVPCRHCLRPVEKYEDYLILAYRPFPALQPYAETGPIFLHADRCVPHEPSGDRPPILDSRDYILRGYSAADRIVYGTGAVVPTPELVEQAKRILSRADVAYVHVRSARNNCYQCRIDRA